MKLYLHGNSCLASGIENWAHLARLTNAEQAYDQTIQVKPTLSKIPPREARRLNSIAKFAIASAEQAVADTDVKLEDLANIFSSGCGDMDIFNHLCLGLASEDKVISPTKFSHSLLNAVAGVWNISTGNTARSLSITAGQYSIGAGLIETVMQCNQEQQPVLLVGYDIATPDPISSVFPVSANFAFALLLSSNSTNAKLSLEFNFTTANIDYSDLQEYFQNNYAAAALPLLNAICKVKATNSPQSVVLEFSQGQNLKIEVSPC